MRPALSLHENRQYPLFIPLFLLNLFFGKNNPPTRFKNLFTGHLKLDLIHFSQHGGSRHLAIGIEYRNKTAGNQIEPPAFHIRQILRIYSGRNNSVVIGHFRTVEYFFGFWKLGTVQRCSQNFIIPQPLQNSRTLRINIITKESRIDTRIGSHFLFIKRLDQFQSLISGISKLFIAFHL